MKLNRQSLTTILVIGLACVPLIGAQAESVIEITNSSATEDLQVRAHCTGIPGNVSRCAEVEEPSGTSHDLRYNAHTIVLRPGQVGMVRITDGKVILELNRELAQLKASPGTVMLVRGNKVEVSEAGSAMEFRVPYYFRTAICQPESRQTYSRDLYALGTQNDSELLVAGLVENQKVVRTEARPQIFFRLLPGLTIALPWDISLHAYLAIESIYGIGEHDVRPAGSVLALPVPEGYTQSDPGRQLSFGPGAFIRETLGRGLFALRQGIETRRIQRFQNSDPIALTIPYLSGEANYEGRSFLLESFLRLSFHIPEFTKDDQKFIVEAYIPPQMHRKAVVQSSGFAGYPVLHDYSAGLLSVGPFWDLTQSAVRAPELFAKGRDRMAGDPSTNYAFRGAELNWRTSYSGHLFRFRLQAGLWSYSVPARHFGRPIDPFRLRGSEQLLYLLDSSPNVTSVATHSERFLRLTVEAMSFDGRFGQ